MIYRIKKTDDKGKAIMEIKNKLNGSAPKGFSYVASPEGDEIVIKVRAK